MFNSFMLGALLDYERMFPELDAALYTSWERHSPQKLLAQGPAKAETVELPMLPSIDPGNPSQYYVASQSELADSPSYESI